METEDLFRMARNTSRDRFVATLRSMFFVTQAAADESIEFDTIVTGRSSMRPPARAGTRVVELVKAAGNPYPDRISIGRARNCDVVLRDASVSKLHAHLRQSPDGSWALVDVGSHNGTRLNNVRLPANELRPVKSGDAVVFGGVTGKILDADGLYTLLRQLDD